MRLLVASTGNIGHFTPMAPLARACVSAGHEVVVAAPESFGGRVVDAGLSHAALGEASPDQLSAVWQAADHLPAATAAATDQPDPMNVLMIREVFGRLDGGAALPRMREIVDAWKPDLILRDPAEIASLVTAEASGIAHVQFGLGLASMLEMLMATIAEVFPEFESAAQLPAGRLADAARGAPVFTTLPAGFDEPEGIGAERQVTRFREPATESRRPLPEWSDPDLPLVYVSFGSVAARTTFAGLYASAIAALAPIEARVLVTIGPDGDPEALRPWPRNVHVERWWPQSDILPVTAVMVGHGGFGTTLSALAAGVPQVVVPLFASDQWLNARRVQETGCGIMLAPGPDGIAGLADAVASLLHDDAPRAAAESLRDQIARLPQASEVVDALVGYGSGGRA